MRFSRLAWAPVGLLFCSSVSASSSDWQEQSRSWRNDAPGASYSDFRRDNDRDNRREPSSANAREAAYVPRRGPPPPPPESAYNPIHYEFQSRLKRGEAVSTEDGGDELPRTQIDGTSVEPIVDSDGAEESPQYASARKDAITKYMATSRGRSAIMLSSGIVGSALGAFVGGSLFDSPKTFAIICFALFVFCTVLRNPYGELVRALGLALIYALQRTSGIRRRYPTLKHIKASVGASPRSPFPPSENPWNYEPVEKEDPEFSMLYSVVAMAFVGSACGGNLPLIPTWLGGLGGAAVSAYSTTTQDARGDLARSMGMKVVALGQEVLRINTELSLLRKTAVVSGKILDKILILDRKHRIKDRIISAGTFLYEQISRTASQVQSDANAGDRRQSERDRPARNERDRRQSERNRPARNERDRDSEDYDERYDRPRREPPEDDSRSRARRR